MKSRISPDIELVYGQLLWIERRRFRLVESVSSHFGHLLVQRVLGSAGLLTSPLFGEPNFSTLLDEQGPSEFLGKLSAKVVSDEAAVITRLRSHVSVYREHVDEQLLFGARTAGQEAGRSFHSVSSIARPRSGVLSVPETVQAVFEINYNGLPGERNHFIVLRSQGGSTIHFMRSPLLEAWTSVSAEPRFLYQIRCEWIRGILDILSPQVEFSATQAIEQGGPYGLEHFYLRGQHAGP